MDKPTALNELLHHNDFAASHTLRRGQFLQRLQKLLASLLDADSSAHCQVGNLRDDALILYCDSTAWASRLRYQIPTLLGTLQQHKVLASLRRIEIKVMPQQVTQKAHRSAATLSNTASSCILACADSVNDQALQSALTRLARHHGKKN